MRTLRTTMLLLAALAMSGCKASVKTTRIEQQLQRPVTAMTQSGSRAVSRDAAAAVPLVFRVEMFVITVPQHSFADNEVFWKRMDEQCLDPGTSDLLQKN